ncbi:MAG TPA: mechanosensitive ion channel domain-containing protein [Candidatus Acidoferrum sp.]|nr:mechanosensitive ion channel domain-containing protein [Candidatus Acidoferrum sp.]
MKPIRKIIAIALVLFLGAAVYGLIRTAQPPSAPRNIGSTPGVAPATVVDRTPITTALKLAHMPTTAEELPFTQEALRIADHETDLAYAAAKRELQEHPTPLSPDAQKIDMRLKEAEDALAVENARVARLTAEEAKATGARQDELHDQLVLATASQQEHQDEVDDAKEDLARAGGDPNSRIEALNQEHEASSKAIDNLQIGVSAVVEEHGLIHRFTQWLALHQKQTLLREAKQQAESGAASFSEKHSTLEAQMQSEKKNVSPPVGPPSTGKALTGSSPSKISREDSAALVSGAKRRASAQNKLASLDKRVEDQKQLADNYEKWIQVLAANQRAVLHAALIGLTIILVILLIGFFFDTWLERLLGKLSLDRRQVETLRTVTRVAVQVFAVLFILLVILGPPQQLGTFLGLAGAGLTVALKDFIVGFLGWFVLMGKNGIRLGDWVEINGVTGEVVELGMFHTVLLETGNWTDSGHPTGRRVTFTNSFAIEGHYFNFSTSGQWLWDELQVVLPAGQDPYPLIDALQKKVLEATAETAKQAEKEWKNAASSRDMKALSAAPAINLKPVVGGVEIAVRYITRAGERYQLRAKLYQAAVDLLGGKNVRMAPPPESTPASASD